MAAAVAAQAWSMGLARNAALNGSAWIVSVCWWKFSGYVRSVACRQNPCTCRTKIIRIRIQPFKAILRRQVNRLQKTDVKSDRAKTQDGIKTYALERSMIRSMREVSIYFNWE